MVLTVQLIPTALGKRDVPTNQIDEYINQVNDLSNLQMLAAIPNIEKQDKDFSDWFESNYLTDTDKIQYRKINYLPEMDYTYGNFIKFMEERKKLLRKQLETELL